MRQFANNVQQTNEIIFFFVHMYTQNKDIDIRTKFLKKINNNISDSLSVVRDFSNTIKANVSTKPDKLKVSLLFLSRVWLEIKFKKKILHSNESGLPTENRFVFEDSF